MVTVNIFKYGEARDERVYFLQRGSLVAVIIRAQDLPPRPKSKTSHCGAKAIPAPRPPPALHTTMQEQHHIALARFAARGEAEGMGNKRKTRVRVV